jgi:hypothetical protein
MVGEQGTQQGVCVRLCDTPAPSLRSDVDEQAVLVAQAASCSRA